MPNKILNSLLKTITFIPGIAGLAAMDLRKSNNSLKETDWSKSVTLTETPKGFEISIALIISKEIQAKIIAKEVESAIRNLAKINKTKLGSLNIYIRGVK